MWASPAWWQRQFESCGLVRDKQIERHIQRCLGAFFDQCAPARRSLFVLRRADSTQAPREAVERISAEFADALAGNAEWADALRAAVRAAGGA